VQNNFFTARGIHQLSEDLRQGKASCLELVKICLDRISALDDQLGSFVHLEAGPVLASASAMDQLIRDGQESGPLTGLPIAVKDIISVKGMPTRGGSRLDIEDLVQPEGQFLKRLRAAGCLILGKTRTIEFALGAQNISHPTPWNPFDMDQHHTAGGSSSGSAVAVAAGLCAFAIGTDTGGSVRVPAALCSLFGFKPGLGLWPTDGVLPLSAELDTLGLITRTAADAATVFSATTGTAIPKPLSSLEGIRLGVPRNHFFDNLDTEVREGFEVAASRLKMSGATLEPMELPEAKEAVDVFAHLVPHDFINTLGRKRFSAGRSELDPVALERLLPGLDLSEQRVVESRQRLQALQQSSSKLLQGLDGFITPTTPLLPVPLSSLKTVEQASAFTARVLQNSRPANLYNFCAASLPIRHLTHSIPIGLQVHCAAKNEAYLLSLCQSMEQMLS